ncbi:MAG TPA: D-aminoacyl-tRNA deacylase [Candidatus Hydrogenedentes bacterium]|nr:D-aminoacyl-tRNA deacylase [Candidatus Hydrogenedentota bacterium]HQE83715.1 D-aminoacyl-tRNA deacylase [Candidatus Hydrogenedentota bacterium]HQH51032.1 D-aminoacyl-tRNA deacylase [Candidatus Hydrogenedentota bacterium]
MRAVIQRVSEALVTVDGRVTGQIGKGLLLLLGVGHEDTEDDARLMAEKVVGLRCFADAESKFNLSVVEVGGAILAISQFTLFGDCRKGRRPSFSDAARPEPATVLYEAVVQRLREKGLTVETGEFGAHMSVHLVNDGPVTLLIDTKKLF